jgi:hypothetical protein
MSDDPEKRIAKDLPLTPLDSARYGTSIVTLSLEMIAIALLPAGPMAMATRMRPSRPWTLQAAAP